MNYVLGIDIGGTNFRIGLVDEFGQLYKANIERSNLLVLNNDPKENLKNYMEEFLRKTLIGNLIGISIGVPSTVSRDRSTIYSTPNLIGFDNISIVDFLEKEFKISVFLERDVNFLLKNDMVDKSIPVDETSLGFYIGTGFGNSIFINGDFLYGKNGAAGELGHIPMFKGEGICGCGNKGCAEIYASGKALNDIKDKFFQDTDIRELFIENGNSDVIREYIDCLSIPVASEINILDPDNVIIGGGVVQMNGFPKQYFEECILRHTRKPFPGEGLKVIYSDGGINSGIIGGAYYTFEKMSSTSKYFVYGR
ncbi:MAG: allose kinase [Clostridia bacterium]